MTSLRTHMTASRKPPPTCLPAWLMGDRPHDKFTFIIPIIPHKASPARSSTLMTAVQLPRTRCWTQKPRIVGISAADDFHIMTAIWHHFQDLPRALYAFWETGSIARHLHEYVVARQHHIIDRNQALSTRVATNFGARVLTGWMKPVAGLRTSCDRMHLLRMAFGKAFVAAFVETSVRRVQQHKATITKIIYLLIASQIASTFRRKFQEIFRLFNQNCFLGMPWT